MIKEVFKVGVIAPPRSRYHVMAKVVEEIGELSTEVAIKQGDSYKQPGPDGVMGEAVDAIVSLIDLIWIDNPEVTEEQIMLTVITKLNKWKSKVCK